MSGQSTILAEGFPPGVKDFEFPDLIPGLMNTPFALSFTKITILVWVAAAIVILFFLLSYRNPKLVPTKKQWIAESIYGFVRDGIAKEVIGPEGVRFAPYLATLFCFILVTNIFGIIPFIQISPNSHIAFPIMLAVISYVMFIWVGVRKHGIAYFKNAVVIPGVPWWIYPILVPIEIFSTFVVRPVSLAIRLFANMFVGHLLLLVFTLGGVVLLESANFGLKLVSGLSFAMAITMTFLELMVQVIQAYVFAMLTASYIQTSLADEH